MPRNILSWLHIGDLHMTDPGLANHVDLGRIVAAIASLPPGDLDLVLLPGDNADDGSAGQFSLVRDALVPLSLPVHILPGDHDFKSGTLDAFHTTLGARRLPYAEVVSDHRCLFLDVVSAGSGGPDFRLGPDQLSWAEAEANAAAAAGQPTVVFMHTYPADLREGADRLGALLAGPDVVCVDMGHTHYNELANDGRTVFMATRSTGQVEEGPPGVSIATVDDRGVAWRFKPLDALWPFVLITSPTDRRLATDANRPRATPFDARALIVGDAPVTAVDLRLDEGAWTPLRQIDGAIWAAPIDAACARLAVRARDARGRLDTDRVELPDANRQPPTRAADGSDRDRIETWPERGIVGGQLGPNRNGHKW